MHNSIVMLTFSALDEKYCYSANFVQKVKVFISSRNFLFRLIWISRIQKTFSLFCFRAEIPSLGKFGRKSQNCYFKPKFHIQTNLNMQNWANLVQKIEIVILSWNFVFILLWVCKFSTDAPFSVLERKYHCWVNFVQKMKIVVWNFIFRLIWICRIQ